MPRVNPSNAQTSFMVYPYLLNDSVKAKLLSLIGYEGYDLLSESVNHQFPGKEIQRSNSGGPLRLHSKKEGAVSEKVPDLGLMIVNVESALGIIKDGRNHLDNIPRPADYVAVFSKLHKHSMELLKQLSSMTGYYRGQFTLKGCDIHKVEQAIASAFDVSVAVLRDFEGKNSRGAAKRNTALCEVIKRLRIIFRMYDKGPKGRRTSKGAIIKIASQDARELEFVQIALQDSKAFQGSLRLAQLFSDTRCAVPLELTKVRQKTAR